MSDLDELLHTASNAIEATSDLRALEELRVHYLGKKGLLTDQLKQTMSSFEYQHPRITAIVNDLMVKLAGLGV